MTELLFMKYDHSTQSGAVPVGNLAALLKTFDLITAGDENAFGTGSISGSVLTITSLTRGSFDVGDAIDGAGIPAGITIVSNGTGSGGTGTYNLSSSLTISSQSITVPYPWGTLDLTNPWFRIVAWPQATLADVQPFRLILAATYSGGVKTTYWQPRGQYLNMKDNSLPAAIQAWWDDDTRAQPKFYASFNVSVVINAIKKLRPVVPV